MVDCLELLDETDGTNYSNNEKFDIKKIIKSLNNKFLCPKDLDALNLQGNYGDDIFDFIKVTIDGCQLNEDECQPEEAVEGTYFNFVMLTAFPNVEDKTQAIEYKEDVRNYYILNTRLT